MVYVESGRCPYCNSENVDFLTSDFYGDCMSYECVCNDCKGTYSEVYSVEFVGVDAGGKYYEV